MGRPKKKENMSDDKRELFQMTKLELVDLIIDLRYTIGKMIEALEQVNDYRVDGINWGDDEED